MAWILKALNSMQGEIRQYEPTSSEPPSAPFDRSSRIEQINEHVYEVWKPLGRPSVELVFFHGLQLETSKETYLTTWVSGGGSELWLDWLSTPFPRARILLVSYNASMRKRDREGLMDKYATCENLVSSLIQGDGGIGQDGCPVVLVGHCLGGLIMKQLCLEATRIVSLNRPEEPDVQALENFLRNIKGLFFYSTPHHGLRLADKSTEFSKGPLFEILTTLNTGTERCNEDFCKLRRKWRWRAVGVGETSVVPWGPFKGLVAVEEASARHDVDKFYTVDRANHFTVCRPDSTKSSSFCMLRDVVADLLQEYKNREGPKVDLHDKVVGLEPQVRKFRELLQTTERLGIVGMGGIGKTTLARRLYNMISGNFDYSCFLPEVKLSMAKKEYPNDLRQKVIRSLCCGQQKVHENFQWRSLKGKRVLIVFDDAETDFQVQVMTEDDGFDAGSRVIVTSRDSSFLIRKKFECRPAEQLDKDESKRLFCLHAFDSAEPPSGYEERMVRMLKKCDGLPLALEVAGKYLYDKPRGSAWDEALETLSRAEPLDGNKEDGLWSILKASYNSLADSEREMFLDIAICYHGERLEVVKARWRAQWDWVDNKWQNLLDKNLVKIFLSVDPFHGYPFVEQEFIQMHEALRDLGRSIACPKSRSVVSHSRVISTTGLPPSLNWLQALQWKPTVKVLKITRGNGFIDVWSLQGLEELEILSLELVNLVGPCNFLPPNLVSLTMYLCQWKSSDVFSRASVRHPKLRHLHVTDCIDVAGLFTGVGEFPALEHLTLKYFRAFPDSRFPSEVLKLHRGLKYLKISFPDYSYCPFPLNLWNRFRDLRSLEQLELVNVRAFPHTICDLEGLTHLKISHSNLPALPDAIGKLEALKHLEIRSCSEFSAIPQSIGNLKALRILKIICCNDLRALPNALLQLEDLEHFNVQHCEHLRIGEVVSTLVQNITRVSWRMIAVHQKAMEKVSGSEYEGALADLDSCSLEELEPQYQGFLLQERGITKYLGGNLQGAWEDLSAALTVFSKADDLHPYQHNCWRHRGFVSFLLDDLDGARKDGTTALKWHTRELPKNVISPSLGDSLVTFMHFRLKGPTAIGVDRMLWRETHHQMLQKVRTSQFLDALALWDAFDAIVAGYFNRLLFLQERGVLKGLASDLHGALEDLTSALEIDDDDYECHKHRGYVKFLLGHTAGARMDAEKCLALGLKEPSDSCLGTGPVAFLEFNL